MCFRDASANEKVVQDVYDCTKIQVTKLSMYVHLLSLYTNLALAG